MSQFKTFLLPLEPNAEAEGEMNGFLRSHRVVDVQKMQDAKGWHFLVEYLDGAGEGGGRGLRHNERIDYMKELEPPVFAVFSRLRVSRKELAKEAGVPPFGIATDAQLAAMAKLEEPSLAKIGSIEGFGEARVKAYGEKFLESLDSGHETDRQPV